MLRNLLKAVVGVVVETPAALATDVLTLGGTLTGKEQPYTTDALQKVLENLRESTK